MLTSQAAVVAVGITPLYGEGDCDFPFPGVVGFKCWMRDARGIDSEHHTTAELADAWFHGMVRDWRLTDQCEIGQSRVACRGWAASGLQAPTYHQSLESFASCN